MRVYKCDLCGAYYDTDEDQYVRTWKPRANDRTADWDERNQKLRATIMVQDTKDNKVLQVCEACVLAILNSQFMQEKETKE